MGSGGGSSHYITAGAGGGALILRVSEWAILNGTIDMSGAKGDDAVSWWWNGGGGGAGGSILIDIAGELKPSSGTLRADGGTGGMTANWGCAWCSAPGGSGGRIGIHCGTTSPAMTADGIVGRSRAAGFDGLAVSAFGGYWGQPHYYVGNSNPGSIYANCGPARRTLVIAAPPLPAPMQELPSRLFLPSPGMCLDRLVVDLGPAFHYPTDINRQAAIAAQSLAAKAAYQAPRLIFDVDNAAFSAQSRALVKIGRVEGPPRWNAESLGPNNTAVTPVDLVAQSPAVRVRVCSAASVPFAVADSYGPLSEAQLLPATECSCEGPVEDTLASEITSAVSLPEDGWSLSPSNTPTPSPIPPSISPTPTPTPSITPSPGTMEVPCPTPPPPNGVYSAQFVGRADGRCFYSLPDKASAATGESRCQITFGNPGYMASFANAHLATILTPGQKAIVLDGRCGHIDDGSPVWTGLQSSYGANWGFRSGDYPSYATSLWAPGQPNQTATGGPDVCGAVVTSSSGPLLDDISCSEEAYVCCSLPPLSSSCPAGFYFSENRCWPHPSSTPSPTPSSTPIPEAQLVDLTCPDFVQDGATWVSDGPVNGQCYYNIKGRSSNWGESLCQNAVAGGHLASFTSFEQKKIVVDDYCGMTDLQASAGSGSKLYWVGVTNAAGNSWGWGWMYGYGTTWAFSDGSDSTYLRSLPDFGYPPNTYISPNSLGGVVSKPSYWMNNQYAGSLGSSYTWENLPSCCSVAVRCPPGYSQGTGNYSKKCLPDNYQRPNVTGPAPFCPTSQSRNVSYDSLTSGYCYSSPGIALPYNEAEAYCQKDTPGGHLALVRDPQQKDTVLNRGCGGKYTPYTYAWTALNDLQQEGKFVATSGDDVSYANTLWWYGEPNDDKGAEDCALANAFSIGTISNGGCWQSYQVCCEAKLACPAGFEYDAANNQCLPASRPKDVCPIGNTGPKADWFSRKYFQAPNSNNCLRGIDVPLSQMDAEEACGSDTRGSHLTSFSSQKEMEAVFSSGCGGSYSGNATQYWLGARYENDRWTFASGADVSFIDSLISPASMASLQNFTGPLCAISGVSKDSSAFKVRVVSCDAYYPICCQTRSSCPEGTRASNPSDPNSPCVNYSPSPSPTSARTPSHTPTRTRTRSSSPSKYSSLSSSATVSPLLKTDFDGSFEEPGLSWWYSHTGYYPPSSIGRWQVTSGSVDLVRSTWTPKGGSQSLDLAGGSPGTITQTARGLMPGGSYRLSFWYSGNFDSNGAPLGRRSASVLIDGKEVATVVADNTTPDFAGWSSWNPMWKQMEVTFVATSTSVEISFRSLSGAAENAGSGVTLDEVTLDAIYPSATPTPLPTPTHSYGAGVTPTAAATLSPIPMVSFDGGFESPGVSYYMNSQYVQWPGNYLGSWFVSRGNVKIVHENWWPSAYGQQSVDLVGYAGYGPGAIQQTAYNLLPGHVYRLTFWYAGNFADAGTHAAIVRVDGRELATVYANQSMPEFEGSTARNPAYQFVQLNFTASGSSALIAFEAVESWQAEGGVILDEVKIEATPPSPSQTPTPSPSITASRTPSPSNSGTPSNSPTPSTSRRPGISLMKPWNGQSVVRGAPVHVEWYGLQRCDENTVTIKLLLPTYRKATGMNGTASKVSWNNNAPAEFVLAEALQGCLGAIEVILPDFIAPGGGYTLSIHVDSGYIFGVSTESAKLVITNNAGSLQCQEAQPWRLMASGKAIQKRWSLPGTVLTLPLRIDGLPWSKLLATRSAIVTALQVDVSRILSIVTSNNRRNPADDVPKPLDVDVDWAKSGPATIAASSSSLSEAVMFPDDMDAGLYSTVPSIVRVPSGNASTLAVAVFFAAADFGGTTGARDTARFAATVMSRYIPGYGEPQGLPPAQTGSSALSLKMADVLPWTMEAATRAARLSALENLDESFYGVEITVDKDFGASSGSFDKSCASFADPFSGGAAGAIPTRSPPSPSLMSPATYRVAYKPVLTMPGHGLPNGCVTKPLTGRYIKYSKANVPFDESTSINVYEIEAFGYKVPTMNLALTKPVSMTSQHYIFEARYATDGMTRGEEGVGGFFFAHTSMYDTNPALTVDLGATVDLSMIVVWPRFIARNVNTTMALFDSDGAVVATWNTGSSLGPDAPWAFYAEQCAVSTSAALTQ
jgi:Lectin C-type domain/Protein of unknown function (DUF642)